MGAANRTRFGARLAQAWRQRQPVPARDLRVASRLSARRSGSYLRAMHRITILAAAVASAAALAAGISSSWADGYGHGGHGGMPMTSHGHTSSALAKSVADLRFVLSRYATDLDAAKQAGWGRQITPFMEGMGFHFMDPTVSA